jgi:hypothetical protein
MNFLNRIIYILCLGSFLLIPHFTLFSQMFGGQIRSAKKAGEISTLECASASHQGNLVVGLAASSITTTIPYTDGNQGFYPSISVASTGVLGLTATLSSGRLNSGNGDVVLQITGTPASSGTANFSINILGKSCTFSRTVAAATIDAINCASATHSGNLISGTAASSVSSLVPYTGGNGGSYNAFSVASTGVTGLTATISAGSFNVGSGNLNVIISGTPAASGTASFALNIGGKTCTLTRSVIAPTSFSNCAQASAGTMTINTGYTAGSVTQTVRLNVTVTGSYSISTNTVAGVTFSASGTFASTGTQDVVLVATGTPNASGTYNYTATLSGAAGSATCVFSRYIRPVSTSRSLSGFGSNGCNGCAQGGGDTRTNGWQDNGGSFSLTGGNYSLSFSVNITANGTVCSGAPNKPLEGRILLRLRNTSTNATYLTTGGGRTTFSGCTTRGTGSHSASGGYSNSAGTTFLPAGTYVVQIYGESYMGGCSSGGSDQWAGCGLSSGGGGSISINAQ